MYQLAIKCLQQLDFQHRCRGCIPSVYGKHLQEKGTCNNRACLVISHTHISKLGVCCLFPQKNCWIRILHVWETLLRPAADTAKRPCKPTNCRHKPTSTTLSYSFCSSKMVKPREDITSNPLVSIKGYLHAYSVLGEHTS